MINLQPALPAHASPMQRIGDAWHAALDAYGDWRQRRALRRELDKLDTQQLLDATLSDIGLSRAQMPSLVNGMRRHRLFRRMLGRLGIESSRLADRAQLNEIMWTCASCTAGKQCRHWLESGATQGYQAFCPNAETLERLAAQRSSGAPN